MKKVDVRNYDLDLVEIRYAEVLLNLAECAAEVGNKDPEVYTILKEIRKRAGITANADELYGLKANMTKQELIDAVLFERRIELAYEGKRFWDMRRRMMFSDPEYKGYARERIEIEPSLCPTIGYLQSRSKVSIHLFFPDPFFSITHSNDTVYSMS